MSKVEKMNLKTSKVIIIIFSNFFMVLCSKRDVSGTPCVMKDGSDGICVRLSQCAFALKDLLRFQFPKLCSFHLWNPTVCCIDCSELHNDDYSHTFLVSAYEKVNDRCLDEVYDKFPCNEYGDRFKDLDNSVICYSNPREMSPVIANGRDADRAEFPHMALIGYGDDQDSAEWMCGGTLISDKFILSAAHCISSPALGEIKYAALGILKRTDVRTRWQIYDVAKIIPHPEYKPPSKYHDIALLGTRSKMRFNDEVLPACLNRQDSLPPSAVATGWGAMGHGRPLADVLQAVSLDKYTDEACAIAYPVHRHLKKGYDKTTQVCYGDEEQDNDTCQGDSGGPLQVKTEDKSKSKCIYTVIGVTSYGKACGYIGSSGMYTRVHHYLPWIESVTGKLI